MGLLLGRPIGTVHGIPTEIPPGLTATLVRTYIGSSPSQDFNLTPMPVQNVSFSRAMFMNRPTAAEIRWTYSNGVSWVVAVTPLIMN